MRKDLREEKGIWNFSTHAFFSTWSERGVKHPCSSRRLPQTATARVCWTFCPRLKSFWSSVSHFPGVVNTIAGSGCIAAFCLRITGDECYSKFWADIAAFRLRIKVDQCYSEFWAGTVAAFCLWTKEIHSTRSGLQARIAAFAAMSQVTRNPTSCISELNPPHHHLRSVFHLAVLNSSLIQFVVVIFLLKGAGGAIRWCLADMSPAEAFGGLK